jgi:HAMP domain-containing protein
MSRSKLQRKKVYVDKHVQGGIVVRLGAIWLLTTSIAIGVSALLQFLGDPTIGFEAYVADFSRYWVPTLMAFGAMLPIAGLHLVRFTHRFVGPIVRLRRLMRELADGKTLQPVKFREKDYWHDLADEFNRVAEELNQLRQQVGVNQKPSVSPVVTCDISGPAILPLIER